MTRTARIRGVQSKAAGNGSSIEDRLRELEEEGIISREIEPRATLEEVRLELEEAWSANPHKPGGLARFLESR